MIRPVYIVILALFIFAVSSGGCGLHNRRAPTKEDVPILIAKLSHRSWKERVRAAGDLNRLGEEAEEAVPYLVEALADRRWEVRRAAAYALSSFANEPTVTSSLAVLLKDERADVRRAAVESIASGGSAALAVLPDIIEALKDEDAAVREQAVDALQTLGLDPAEVAKPLLEIVNSSNKDTRIAAIRVFAVVKPNPEAISRLLDALKDEDRRIREAAIMTLSAIGPEPGVVQGLAGVVSSEEPEVQGYILRVLGEFGTASKDAVGVLIELVKEGQGESPKLAVETLGKIGPDAADALPTLMEALKEKVIPFRPVSAAIEKIARRSLRDVVVEGLSSDDPSVRAISVSVLLNIPRDAEGNYWVEDTMRRGLENKYIDVRYAIALDEAQRPWSSGVVKTLVQRLADDDPAVREETYAALREIGEMKVGALLLVIKTPGEGPAREESSVVIEAPEPLTTAKLIGLLRHDDAQVRWAAARILDYLEADLSESIGTMAELLKDGKLELRQWAIRKLKEIQIEIDEALQSRGIASKKGGSESRYRANSKPSTKRKGITEALPAVVEALGDINPFVVEGATQITERFNAEAMPYLIEAAKGDDPDVRGGVAEYVVNTDRDVKALAPALIGMLDDMRTTYQGGRTVAQIARSAVMHIDPDAEAIRIGVIDVFRNKDIEHIALVIQGLSSMGTFPDPYQTINELSMAGDEETRTKAITMYGKVRFGNDSATLPKLLSDENANIRKATLEAMTENGYYGKQAAAPLVKMLEKDSPELRALAADALIRMPPSEDVVKALIKALDDEYPPVRASSAAALGSFGAEASDALPRLHELSEKDEDIRAREIAKSAIRKIEAG